MKTVAANFAATVFIPADDKVVCCNTQPLPSGSVKVANVPYGALSIFEIAMPRTFNVS